MPAGPPIETQTDTDTSWTASAYRWFSGVKTFIMGEAQAVMIVRVRGVDGTEYAGFVDENGLVRVTGPWHYNQDASGTGSAT